jgi:hypothetical protein
MDRGQYKRFLILKSNGQWFSFGFLARQGKDGLCLENIATQGIVDKDCDDVLSVAINSGKMESFNMIRDIISAFYGVNPEVEIITLDYWSFLPPCPIVLSVGSNPSRGLIVWSDGRTQWKEGGKMKTHTPLESFRKELSANLRSVTAAIWLEYMKNPCQSLYLYFRRPGSVCLSADFAYTGNEYGNESLAAQRFELMTPERIPTNLNSDGIFRWAMDKIEKQGLPVYNPNID